MSKTTLKPDFPITMMLFTFLCLSAVLSFGQNKGTFTDNRNGHTYRWAMFGKQAWMLGNLDYKTPAGSWVYNTDSTKEAAYGRLYDWTTAQKACMKGWHLPSDGEWNALITFFGGDDLAGGRFQDADSIPKAAMQASGVPVDNFSSLLAGIRHSDGSFTGLGLWGGYWSYNKTKTVDASNYLFTHNGKAIGRSSNDKTTGFSVKCVRNK